VTTTVRRISRSSLAALLAFIFVVVVAAYGNERNSCLRQADIRAQSQVRGSVLIGFLASAAEARQASADNPAANPRQRQIDQRAADQYRAYAARVRPLQQLDCGLPWPETPDRTAREPELQPYDLPR
jgi:hypothetical protein